MGYLLCDKCNGYYKLQGEESPDDFEVCNCGGKLKYVESVDYHSFKNTNNEHENFTNDKSYVVKVCEDCNEHYKIRQNESDNFNHCQCGGELKCIGNIDESSLEVVDNRRERFSTGKSFVEKKASYYSLIMGIGGLMALIGGFGLLVGGINYENSAIILGFLLAAGVLIFRFAYRKGYSWIKGAEGERIVANHLALLPQEYSVFNDVMLPNSKGNIDHIVLGPNGIFVIETKNLSGYFNVYNEEWFCNGRRAYSQPGWQVLGNTQALKEYLLSEGVNVKDLWLNSLVALPHKNFSINRAPLDYHIVRYSFIPKFILKKKTKVNENALKEIVTKLTACKLLRDDEVT